MSEEIKFNKKVYNKTDYEKVIDTSFKELGVTSIQEQIPQQPNIEDFFNMYNEVFYDIPELGDINSHEFLIKKSSEYVNYEANNEEIQALQDEIAQLRIDLLDAQQQIIELQTGTTP